MLELKDVDRVAYAAAASAMKQLKLSRVFSAVTTDSMGNEALLVTIVLPDEYEAGVSGDSALDTIVGVQRDLYLAGEQRFPIINFATEHDLADDGSSES